MRACARYGADGLVGLRLGKQILQRLNVVGEMLGCTWMNAQRAHGELIRARRPAEAQIDAARIQRGQRAELLGHHQRRMVGQHDAARADADAAGA